jgi:O-acetyl-ADP-ribose deacetylase (regulator of RNase III)
MSAGLLEADVTPGHGGGAPVRLHLVTGDITRVAADAIVNAANESLLGGGGVDGAIHRAGGPAILEACRRLGGCRPGEAKATTAGRLPARYVVHTVGPRYSADPEGAPAVLAAAYHSSLAVAEGAGCTSVAFPSISTGAFGYPLDAAARVAVRAVVAYVQERPRPAPILESVTFVLFDGRTRDAYAAALGEVLGGPP